MVVAVLPHIGATKHFNFIQHCTAYQGIIQNAVLLINRTKNKNNIWL